MKNRSGFTLVELIITVSIISVLAAFGYTIYANAQAHARDGRRKGDIREIQKALEQYNAASGNNSYPATQADLYSSATISNSTYFNKGSTPNDPTTSSNYTYFGPSGSCKKFIVCATLERNTGNRDALATACADAVENSPAGGFYCLGSLQN